MNRGLSGNSILRCGDVVIKATSDKSYINRLKRQKEKQVYFSSVIGEKLDKIKCPQVVSCSETKGHYSYVMENVNYLTCSNFFDLAGKKEINKFIGILKNYIEVCISLSKEESIDKRILYDKINSVYLNIKPEYKCLYKSSVAYLIEELGSLDEIIVPVGIHHGDLTFSNILFSRDCNDICFLDFLDSFTDSVILDVVKIRQDTKHLWTEFVNNEIPTGKRMVTMSYIDFEMDLFFRNYSWYRDYYSLFEKLNLLRIAPYAEEQRVHDFIFGALNEES